MEAEEQQRLRAYSESDPVIVLALLKQAVENMGKQIQQNNESVTRLIGDGQQKIGKQEAEVEALKQENLKRQNEIKQIAWKSSTVAAGVGAITGILAQIFLRNM